MKARVDPAVVGDAVAQRDDPAVAEPAQQPPADHERHDRVRVIDPSFRRLSEARRDNRVWKYLERLPEDVLSHLSMVLAFTPEEAKTSPLNYDFEHPTPMRL